MIDIETWATRAIVAVFAFILGLLCGLLIRPQKAEFVICNSDSDLSQYSQYYEIAHSEMSDLVSRANGGDGLAAYRISLSILHSKQRLSDSDLIAGVKWLSKAARTGNVHAQVVLVRLRTSAKNTDKESLFENGN